MNFWLFFLLRHFHGRNNFPILIASLFRRTGGGVLGLELAPATGVEIPTSVAFKNVGARLVGTVLPPFITMVFSLRPGSLFERSRERSRFPEGEILPSSATSIFLRCHRLILAVFGCGIGVSPKPTRLNLRIVTPGAILYFRWNAFPVIKYAIQLPRVHRIL